MTQIILTLIRGESDLQYSGFWCTFGFSSACFITLRNVLQIALEASPGQLKEGQQEGGYNFGHPYGNIGANQVSQRMGEGKSVRSIFLSPTPWQTVQHESLWRDLPFQHWKLALSGNWATNGHLKWGTWKQNKINQTKTKKKQQKKTRSCWYKSWLSMLGAQCNPEAQWWSRKPRKHQVILKKRIILKML